MRYNISIIKNQRLGAGHLCGSDYLAENKTDMWNILRRDAGLSNRGRTEERCGGCDHRG